MKFNDKLVFLMDTAHVSNKVLADSINIDPSMISLLRTGKRGKPRNQDVLRAMADYFAGHCTNSYQKEAIGEALGQFNLKYQSRTDDIADLIYSWLADDHFHPQNSLARYLSGSPGPAPSRLPLSPENVSYKMPYRTLIFYNQEGKEKAFRYFYDLITRIPDLSETIYITSDESSEWFLEGNIFGKDVGLWKYLLDHTNCKICHILPPPSSSLFLDVLANWFPLYLTGRVNVFFYPRTRDRVFRRSMVLVPGIIGLLSASVESETESPYIVVTEDADFIQANLTLFQDFLIHCTRTMNSYLGPQNIQNCFLKYISYDMGYIQLSKSLSVTTMPISCMKKIFGEDYIGSTLKNPGDVKDHSYEAFYRDSNNRFKRFEVIDICPLATKDDLLAGKATQFYPGSRDAYPFTYTVETYLDHLKNIIQLMKTYPKYSFVPYPRHAVFSSYILVKENRYALIVHNSTPVCALGIDQPVIIEPFYEYLMSLAESVHYSGAGRSRIIGQLEALAEELEASLN